MDTTNLGLGIVGLHIAAKMAGIRQDILGYWDLHWCRLPEWWDTLMS